MAHDRIQELFNEVMNAVIPVFSFFNNRPLIACRLLPVIEREASVITYWFHRIRKRRLEPCGTR